MQQRDSVATRSKLKKKQQHPIFGWNEGFFCERRYFLFTFCCGEKSTSGTLLYIICYTILRINDGWLISNQNLCVINSIAFSNKQLKLNNTQERLSDLETTLKTKTQLSKELQKNIGKIWQQVSKRETADTGWVTLRALAREMLYELFVLKN